MNILFFLTPKSEVSYVYNDNTLQEALRVLRECHYSSIPIINRKGEYKGTVTEGDLLWALYEDCSLNAETLKTLRVSRIHRRTDNKPVHTTAEMNSLIHRVINQNFVPVVDDDDVFIGIVKRSDIIRYYYNQSVKMERKD